MQRRIAFISINDHTPWGGSEVFWTELAKRLLEDKSFQVGISTKKWNRRIEQIDGLIEKGAVDFRRDEPQGIKSTFRNILRRFRKNKSQNILQELKPDLVFISIGDHLKGAKIMNACHELQIPYIPIVQLVQDIHIPTNPKYFTSLRKGYLNACQLFVTSNDNLNILKRQFLFRPENVTIINNPIKKLDEIPDFPENATYKIAVVANLNVNHKSQDVILSALSNREWERRDVQFNFYGEGVHKDYLLQLSEFYGLKKVVFHGRKSIEEIWSTNHILLLPSKMEGLSLAFLEAMYHRRTAIISDLGDSSRFIRDGVNGFLINGQSVSEVNKSLNKAWEMRHEWKEMGELAKKSLDSTIREDSIDLAYNWIQSYFENS